jgi:phage terminase large subunit GpA-like protein
MLDASVIREIAGAWLTAAAPPPEFTVSQWADERRFLPETSALRGARWKTDLTPYLRGIMDAVHEPGTRTIAVMKAAQVGGSECLHNILGFFIEHDPCPILLVHPTADVAEEWSKERLDDMIRTSALEAVIEKAKSTLTFKVFLGGFLALGGANTPNTFARRAVRIAIGDDVDRWPPVVGEEGDPADLLNDRHATFHDGLSIFVSTPTLKHGRIDTLFQRSDQRRYHVECPGCGRWDWIAWNDDKHFRVSFQDRDPDTARLECPACHLSLYEPERRQMIAGGEWRPTATPQEAGLVGFHLPAMLSTLGSVSLSSLVGKFLTANAKGKESLRVFINQSLAEGWEEHGTRMQPQMLFHRREAYGAGIEVPAPAAILTAGIDVQHNRFEVQVQAWGPSGERWVVDYQIIDGDPKHAETQGRLFEVLHTRYTHALGPQIAVLAACLDTGYATETMYDLVLSRRKTNLWATKGVTGGLYEPLVGRSSDKRYGKQDRPVTLYPVNTDKAKSDLYGDMALAGPGPGFIHFPTHVDRVDEEYFDQLCAEHRETRYNRQGVATHTVWVQDRERNEALDTAVLCLAAYHIFNGKKRYAEFREAIRIAAEAMPKPEVTPANDPDVIPASPPPAPQPPARVPARRTSRSSYLGR